MPLLIEGRNMETKIIDPRISLIDDNLKNIRNIILVSGFKGGIGKSLISAAVSIALKEKGFKTALFDLDVTSFTCHTILGAYDLYPEENNGIVPPSVDGIYFMSFEFFARSKKYTNLHPAAAMRGESITHALKEILCITRWGEIDYLIIDMPPGFYDTAFEVMNLIKRFKIIAVKTPSPLSSEVYNRMIKLYTEKGYEIIEIENMSEKPGDMKIVFDPSIDRAIGDIGKIKKTLFYKDVLKIAEKI